MPDPSIQPPYLVPSAYPDYLDMQRKQMLASMLMQNTQQSSQTPADWNQMKLRTAAQPALRIYRRSPRAFSQEEAYVKAQNRRSRSISKGPITLSSLSKAPILNRAPPLKVRPLRAHRVRKIR